ncbi:MAG: hypothetical protein LUG61_01485 [Lachnospiraceae bacterium]|nr:hypothetical protein [Lachnospiraceae bacterium]
MGSNLVITEVSQKQAYIFSSNRLRDNITNSAVIAYVTSSRYFKDAAGSVYTDENEVYCGGGHAILEFANHETAVQFVRLITGDVRRRFPGLELFATIHECEEEPNAESIFRLIQKLEKKKSVRRASFGQGTFGVEEVEAVSRKASVIRLNGSQYEPYSPDDEADRASCPEGFERAFSFENLGGSKGDSNFIAVVHIDGNAMGKRVEELRETHGAEPWQQYRKTLKEFSEAIASDFRDTFREMREKVADQIEEGKIGALELTASKNGAYYFPVRRVITEGDDICFVTEGRIGIECARIFMELLSARVNRVDGKHYAACAGVAIVHQKYPFYRAYELAEELCSNAKKFVANSTKNMEGTDSSMICAIDWHLEFGELGDDIGKIRERYETADSRRLEMRPYVVCGPDYYMEQEHCRDYHNFRKIIRAFEEKKIDYARGKIKELRTYLRQGETAARNYLKTNLIDDLVRDCYMGIYQEADLSRIGTGQRQKSELFVTTADQVSRSILFDAIEAMDTFISLDVQEDRA